MKRNRLKAFLDSKYFTMLLSFFMAVAIWLVVVSFFSTDARTTIKDVPVDIDYNASYLNLELEIIEQSIETVDVTVVGPRDVVGTLTKDDIIVYPNINNVKMAGKYELSLNAVKKSGIKEYQIESLSSYQVAVRFDHLTEKSFKIDVDISNLTIPEDLMVDKITITPDSVVLKGPENTVNKINRVVATVQQQELGRGHRYQDIVRIREAQQIVQDHAAGMDGLREVGGQVVFPAELFEREVGDPRPEQENIPLRLS